MRCFFCYGGLQSWEQGDDPWTEHARWFPRYHLPSPVQGCLGDWGGETLWGQYFYFSLDVQDCLQNSFPASPPPGLGWGKQRSLGSTWTVQGPLTAQAYCPRGL